MKANKFYLAAATACWLVAAAYLPAPEQGAGTKAGAVFRCDNGRVNFKSDAPLEVIEARSNKLRGAIDASDQSFAWIVDIATFEGFNSPLQREPFNENYLETSRFPNATFTGKLIEKIDFHKDGSMPVRAKGKWRIHGVEQERIIKGRVDIRGQRLAVRSAEFKKWLVGEIAG